MRFGKAPRPTGVVLSASVGVPPQVTSELRRVVQPRGAGASMKHRYLKIKKINRSEILRGDAWRFAMAGLVKVGANPREQGNDP
jgi:hypothetical protein